jgi:hypothetical protein
VSYRQTDDVGRQIRVIVNFTDDLGRVESVTSAATTPVANRNDAPVGAPAIDGTLSGPQIALPEKVGPLQGATASTVGGTANNPIPFRLAADPDPDDNRDGLKLVIDLPRFFMTMPDGDLSPSARQNLDYEIAKQNDNDTDFSENYADQTQFGDYGVFELAEAGTYRFTVTGTDSTHIFYVNVTFNGQVTHLLGSSHSDLSAFLSYQMASFATPVVYNFEILDGVVDASREDHGLPNDGTTRGSLLNLDEVVVTDLTDDDPMVGQRYVLQVDYDATFGNKFYVRITDFDGDGWLDDMLVIQRQASDSNIDYVRGVLMDYTDVLSPFDDFEISYANPETNARQKAVVAKTTLAIEVSQAYASTAAPVNVDAEGNPVFPDHQTAPYIRNWAAMDLDGVKLDPGIQGVWYGVEDADGDGVEDDTVIYNNENGVKDTNGPENDGGGGVLVVLQDFTPGTDDFTGADDFVGNVVLLEVS